MRFDIITFTLLHVVLSLVGIIAGLVVAGGLASGRRLDGWTGTYLATTVLTNLTGFNVSQFSGMAGLSGTATTGIGALLLGLFAWIAAPLGLATVFFARREL